MPCVMFLCDSCIADPTQVIGLFPELLPSEFRKQLEYPAPPPQLTAGELEKGCLALVEYLTQVMQIHSGAWIVQQRDFPHYFCLV